jgi:hypothetical protein
VLASIIRPNGGHATRCRPAGIVVSQGEAIGARGARLNEVSTA